MWKQPEALVIVRARQQFLAELLSDALSFPRAHDQVPSAHLPTGERAVSILHDLTKVNRFRSAAFFLILHAV